jgi:16S rRNA (adenine1518-N6/adenine1519-N6)-dimethyltransferase
MTWNAETSLYQRTRALALEAGLRPSKRLGQSFLIDASIARRIVELARPPEDGWLLEIGPGLGALSFELAAAGVPVVAVERDLRLARLLGRELAPAVRMIAMDATRLDWARIGRRPPVLVSNLPYPITSEVLLALAQSPPPVRRAVLMLQREVVERIAAPPGDSERGSLGVLVQLCYDVRRALRVPPQCFWPRPEVHSSVVVLEPRAQPPVLTSGLRRLLKEGFGQRRKTLANALGVGRARPADLLERAGLPSRVRAQDLTNQQWLDLAQLLQDGWEKD